MDDLMAFVRARLDEDEKAAKEAPWQLDEEQWPFWIDADDHQDLDATERYRDQFPPARALADIEAKRKVLELIPDIHDVDEMVGEEWRSNPCHAVALLDLLAAPYATHPDFREEWKP